MDDRLSKTEIRKDALQETAQSVAGDGGRGDHDHHHRHQGRGGCDGGLATDIFEIRDGVRRASERADDTME